MGREREPVGPTRWCEITISYDEPFFQLLVRVLLTVPEAGESEDSKRETKATTLDDFSPVFLAASCDDRPNKTYSLLILTLKQMVNLSLKFLQIL